MLEILPITSFDAKACQEIRELAHDSWTSVYPKILPAGQCEYMLKEIFNNDALAKSFEQGSTYLLMKMHREPIGFSEIHELEEGVIKLGKLYLAERWQGKDMGSTLLQETEEIAEGNGYHKMVINVNRQNPALQFYQRMGYTITKEVDIPFGPYRMVDYVLERDLA